jgi:hypothetical protein
MIQFSRDFNMDLSEYQARIQNVQKEVSPYCRHSYEKEIRDWSWATLNLARSQNQVANPNDNTLGELKKRYEEINQKSIELIKGNIVAARNAITLSEDGENFKVNSTVDNHNIERDIHGLLKQ